MTDFADHLRSKSEMKNCIVCSSPTRSHVVLLAYDSDSADMVGVESRPDADGFGAVCHGCYTDADGDADTVVALYNERLDTVLDALGVDKEELSQRPDEVAGYEYECGACDEVVPAADVPAHRDGHDDVAVTFSRADLPDAQ